MIAGLLLAAGRGRRFGGDKLAAKLRGRAVIRWSAEALGSGVDSLFVVVPLGTNAATRALSKLDMCLVENWARDEGMASSIRAGIEALPSSVDAVVIGLADQPLASRSVVAALCERFRQGDAAAVVPFYRDGRGHPVLFGRTCFPALLELRGDAGARSVLDALGAELVQLPIDALMPRDIDTPGDLAVIEASGG